MGDSCKHRSFSNKPYKKIRLKKDKNEYDNIDIWLCMKCNKKFFYSDMYNEGDYVKIAPGMYALSLKPKVKNIKEKKKREKKEDVHCEIVIKKENEYIKEKNISACGSNVIRLINMNLSWRIDNHPGKYQIYSATNIKNTEVCLEVIYDKLQGKIYNLQVGKKLYDDIEWCKKLEKHILNGGTRHKPIIVKNSVIQTEEQAKQEKNNLRQARIKKAEIANKNLEYENQLKFDEQVREKELAERRKKEQENSLKREEENRLKRVQLKQQYLETLPQIGMKTILIRKNTFKCMHNQHHVKNVDVAIKIISKKSGECYLEQVAAGYCIDCGHYYILESTYNNLKSKGIIACRVCDEKSISKYSSNGMILAQESILMQCGYNVSQTEGLSEKARRKILALLIDERILSKNDIISYLDFFISQRQYQDKFQVAISKWENDAEFVRKYRTGEYLLYGVNAIYR